MSPKPAPGTPLHVVAYPLARTNTLDPRNAMANVLAAYLRCATFRISGGLDADTVFNLEDVLEEWPDPSVELLEPVASIVREGAVPYRVHNCTPTPCEDTWDQCAETMLWKTGEAVADFQVDFWAQDTATRTAMAAALPALFNLGEERSGVLLAGDPEYFDRTVRATLLDHMRHDNPDSVYGNERRLTAKVRCEVDVVHLRHAKPLELKTPTEVL